MAALKLIDALPDFGPAPGQQRPGQPQAAGPAHAAAPAAPPPDIGAIVRAEVAQAESALAMRLSVEHETALLAERQQQAEAAEAMLRRLGEEAGTSIAEKLAAVERGVGEHVSATVARLLGGILSEDLQKRSIDSLARLIVAAVGDAEAIRIEVRAPQSLFSGLSAALAGHAASLHHIETEAFDLSVTIDGTVFETRLSEWSAVLSEILA